MNDNFKAFYHCHCKQCQQLTGSAFASNIFTDPDNIEWVSGEGNVVTYEHPEREFSKAFCRECGSALPFVNKTKTSLIVPAGSLNEMPDIKPQANIFSSEEACWLKEGLEAKNFSGFPE
ncbi:GFA family protein [Bacterioplanoides sp.]|uniref:GFA family protein n=1 Tax=Bacterioplanoides sp. TaxID=2066072 RepID=UPI003B00472F